MTNVLQAIIALLAHQFQPNLDARKELSNPTKALKASMNVSPHPQVTFNRMTMLLLLLKPINALKVTIVRLDLSQQPQIQQLIPNLLISLIQIITVESA